MEIKQNKPLIEKKFAIIKAFESGKINKHQYDQALTLLDDKIREVLTKILVEEAEIIRTKVKKLNTLVKDDGDLKRYLAKMLINLLSKELDDKTIKGVFRQGYKIMRP